MAIQMISGRLRSPVPSSSRSPHPCLAADLTQKHPRLFGLKVSDGGSRELETTVGGTFCFCASSGRPGNPAATAFQVGELLFKSWSLALPRISGEISMGQYCSSPQRRSIAPISRVFARRHPASQRSIIYGTRAPVPRQSLIISVGLRIARSVQVQMVLRKITDHVPAQTRDCHIK